MKIYISKLVIAILLTIYSLFQFATNDVSASCIMSSLPYQKENADIIVLGKVGNISSVYTTIQVERYYKGQGGPSQINVTGRESTDASVVTSIDFQFEQGKKYLLFLKNDSSGVLRTNDCMGNKEINDSLNSEDIAVLGPGNPPTSSERFNTPPKQEGIFANNTMQYIILGIGGIAILGTLFFVYKKSKP